MESYLVKSSVKKACVGGIKHNIYLLDTYVSATICRIFFILHYFGHFVRSPLREKKKKQTD